MLFEHYSSPDLLTPSVSDGGLNKLQSSLTSLDFYLLDDIDAYLPPLHSEKTKSDFSNDSTPQNSACQLADDFFSELDLSEFDHFEERSDYLPIDEIDIEKWISQSSFPSPPMETANSCSSNLEDTSSWFADQYPINVDMTVPASPPSLSSSSSSSSLSSSPAPSSSSSSSPAPILKRPKLSTVERKMRKKGQNKTAAEKYRIKKKSEQSQLLDRHAALQVRNRALKSELEDLTFRVQQFKEIFANLVQSN